MLPADRGRRASCEDALPAISGLYRFAKNVQILGTNHTLITGQWSGSQFGQQILPMSCVTSQFEQPAVGFTGIGKGFALSILDLKQPFPMSRMGQT